MGKDIVKPATLAGFMELLPEEQIIFNRMQDIIRHNYEKYGFLPINTPNIERSEILLAKGGGETEKQMYRFKKGKTDMALRFDLTVPLARYVAQHYSELEFPFRRYHIGKVYRGERNQRGRFREFYQCDIDIVGNNKLDIKNDAEIPSIIYSIFKEFDFGKFTININNRRLLTGFFKSLDIEDSTNVLRIIDKIDKIGEDKVREELLEEGLDQKVVESIMTFISIDGSNDEIIEKLRGLAIEEESYLAGLEELETVNKYIQLFGVPEDYYKINTTIARGLDYYTGTIYETFLDDHREVGSVCSGGRYDDLASNYTSQKLPGVGISIGLTRLFDQLNYLGLLKTDKKAVVDILIIPMKGCEEEAVKLANSLRAKEIYTQIYLESGKMGRKFAYADKLNIPYVIVLGESEIEKGIYGLKDMESGDQEDYSLEEIISKFQD